MKSYREFSIELFEEYDSVAVYTIRFKGEALTEFDKFVNRFKTDEEHIRDLQKIIAWLDKITNRGVLERYFRPESKMNDGVGAIPVEFSGLRLYCLRISDAILIIGNGGYKPESQKTYNTDPWLNDCVEVLAHLDALIKRKCLQSIITIDGKNIHGDLSFILETKGKTI